MRSLKIKKKWLKHLITVIISNILVGWLYGVILGSDYANPSWRNKSHGGNDRHSLIRLIRDFINSN
mgnify:CR=1 FL=1